MNLKIRTKKRTSKGTTSASTSISQIFTLSLVCLLFKSTLNTASADEQRFSIRRREDCVEMNSKSNCQCERAFIHSAFEVMCPKPLNMMDRSKITIYVPLLTDQSLRIECSQMTARDYAILPSMKVGNVSIVQMRNCPLPSDAPIAGVFEKLGLTNVTQLLYESNNLDGNLTRLHLNGLQNLRRLRLKLRNVAHLPEDLFHDLGNLTWLDFRSHNVELPSKLFAPLENLSYLELADNSLTDLPEGIFRNHEKLINLSLWGNELRHLTKDTFESLTSLSSLDLSSNGIETLEPNIFEFLTNLSIINLNSNRIKDLPKGLFAYTKNLSEFRLGNNRVALSTLPDGLLSGLPVLRKINLNCYLKTIPADSFANSPNIEEIYLEDNFLSTLPENLFYDQVNLRELDLSNNHLTELPEGLFQNNKHLKVLKLQKNLLKEITGNLLTPLIAMEELYMYNNYLEKIDPNAFLGPRRLEHLELQNNRIQLDDPITPDSNSPFHALTNLKVLNLRNNSVQYTFTDWRFVMLYLQTLDLSYNKISKVDLTDLQYLSRSQLIVNMTHNAITTINFIGVDILEGRDLDKPLILDLNHNPVNCDCALPNFVQFLRGETGNKLVSSIKIYSDEMVCMEPENLKNKLVREVSYKELVCPLDFEGSETHHCPSNCQCWVRTYDLKIVVDCSNGNRTTIPALPSLDHFKGTELNMENNNLLVLPTMQRTGYSEVTQLMLAGNKLSELRVTNLPPNLTHLDLRFNKFKTLNESVLNYLNKSRTLESLQLSGNPWHCDCSASHLLQYAQSNYNYKKLHDLAQIRCVTPIPGVVFQQLSVSDICPVDKTLVIFLAMLAVFFLLVGLVAVLYMRYQMEIKVWLYAHNMCLWFVTEEELDKDKIYDAFISYSSKDEDFVAKHLVPNLEQGTPAFKICVHYRDFMVGENICTNIENAVMNSRRTIVILTRNFLESAWARQEFRTAHLAALEERKPKVIIILFGDIDNLEDLDPELKAYLKTNTYLTYNDPLFWERLRYAMPHSTNLFANGGLNKHPMKSSVDDKLELINPSPVTPPLTTPPAAEANKNPLIAHLNGGTPQTAIMIANGKNVSNGGIANGHMPAHYYTNGKLQNGHINGAFIINPNAKQSDV